MATATRPGDHPHGCGESMGAGRAATPCNGSSPRVWGKPGEGGEGSGSYRDHPHGCGESPGSARGMTRSRDHPHGCGESLGKALAAARRARDHPHGCGESSELRPRPPPVRWDHPHGCGESSSRPVPSRSQSGSSPRVWGKPRRGGPRARRPGIIPTGVGKAATPSPSRPSGRDHPHGCGESWIVTTSESESLGSSPRVWGKRGIAVHPAPLQWIIPTGVGKASGAARPTPPSRDHPHGCGESAPVWLDNTRTAGSSPRVWGKQGRRRARALRRRIIPTGVGKAPPSLGSCRSRPPWDHPHGCGESLISSSAVRQPVRIIPTGVGKARPSPSR